MPNINFFINGNGLVNTQAFRLVANDLVPLEPNYAEFPQQTARGNGSKRLDTGSANAPVYNWLGLQVFSSASLTHPETGEVFNLLTCLFNVRQSKNIDEVAVTGLDDTIKTFINEGSYEITIKCILSTDNADDYPVDDVKRFIDLLRQKKALEIVSDFLLFFGIYSIVIYDFDVPQMEGVQNMQPFNITAKSDRPVQLVEDI